MALGFSGPAHAGTSARPLACICVFPTQMAPRLRSAATHGASSATSPTGPCLEWFGRHKSGPDCLDPRRDGMLTAAAAGGPLVCKPGDKGAAHAKQEAPPLPEMPQASHGPQECGAVARCRGVGVDVIFHGKGAAVQHAQRSARCVARRRGSRLWGGCRRQGWVP